MTFKDGTPMFNLTEDVESDILNEHYQLTQEEKVRSIAFLKKFQPIKKIENKEKTSSKTSQKIVNLYESIPVEYDSNTVLMFYSKSRNNAAGKGSKEKIAKAEEPSYTELNNITNWRKMLSNFHITRSGKGTIIPIIIDDKKFSSIEHFFHYNKFLDTDLDLSVLEKRKYDDYAEKFILSDKPNSYGKFSGASVKSKGGKKSGYNHRTNWNTIEENGFKI